MSVFDMFRNAPQQQPNLETQQQQQQQDPNANLNDPDKSQKQQQQQNKDGTTAENRSPLAEFSGLWDTPILKEGETIQPDWNDFNSFVPNIKVDPAKLMETAKRIDFAKVMNPERVKAALAGDVGAFQEVFNSGIQAAFAHSAMSTTKIVESLQKQFSQKLIEQGLPHHIKKHTVNSAIDAELPILTDPAVAPIFENMKAQLQAKYPKASVSEITAHAKKLVMNFASAVNTGGKGGTAGNPDSLNQKGTGGLNKTGVGEEDWGDFFGLESSAKK